MNNNYYSIYLESVFDLANSIVIKFDHVVDSINNYQKLINPASFIESDPTTWKYYQNVSGQYHLSDEIMTVVSLDTLEEIIFDKNTLVDHKATIKAYQYGTRYYKELVTKFPDQETLILGILYPVDIQKAIHAKDGEILGYPSYLVEDNEYTLMSDLQNWIDGFIFRWVNKGFSIAHDLYYFTMLSIFYSKLPQVILEIRQSKCRTNEVHSFHVRQYLASNGKLDRFVDQMTKKQSLWLYRNINYIKKNLGRIKTFDFLTEHIMTQRNIPLSGYMGYHDIESMPDQLSPDVKFKRHTLNDIASVETIDPLSLTSILIKEDQIARDNYEVRMNDEPEIEVAIANSLSNKVITKALESTLFDYSESSPYNLESILLNHWIYLSHSGHYNAYVQFNNPVSGELISLPVKDTFILGYYLYCKSFNLELLEVPTVPALRVQRIPMVTADEIMKVADTSLIPKNLAYEMLTYQPQITNIISTEGFRTICQDIYKAANHQRNIVAFQEHYYRRGLAQGMISRIYSDNICEFAPPGTTYEQWFSERNIDIEDYLLTDPYEMWIELLLKSTGSDQELDLSLSSIQNAMTNIMVSLSSYSVQYLNEINKSPLKITDSPFVRPGDVTGLFKGNFHLDHTAVRVLDHTGSVKHLFNFDVPLCGLTKGITSKLQDNLTFEINVKPMLYPVANRKAILVDVSGVSATPYNLPSGDTEGLLPVPGLDIYLSLDDDQRREISDRYDNCYIDNQNG